MDAALRTADAKRTPLRFGILGCAGIAEKFCESVREAGDVATVHAVASRSIEKCKTWVAASATPGAIAYGSYDELLDDPDVEAVYIPLPTGVRAEWALKAAAGGKHVLTEKPVGVSAAEAAAIVKACSDAGVQYMDNTMFMHHERTLAMRLTLGEAAFGSPKLVASCFTVAFPNEEALLSNIRAQAKNEPLGCLGDLGWYNIRFSLWAFGYEMPSQASCHVLESTAEGVPITATAVLRWADGRSATFDCSFRRALRQWAEVVTESHVLRLDDLVVTQGPTAEYEVSTASIGAKALFFPKSVVERRTLRPALSQNAALVVAFAKLVADGAAPDRFWAHVALQTQAVLDACMASGKKGGAWADVHEVSTP